MNIEAEIYPHKLQKMYGLKLEHLRLEFREKVSDNLVSSIVYGISIVCVIAHAVW